MALSRVWRSGGAASLAGSYSGRPSSESSGGTFSPTASSWGGVPVVAEAAWGGGVPFCGSTLGPWRAAPAFLSMFDVAFLPRFLLLDSAYEPTLFCLFLHRSRGLVNWHFAWPFGFAATLPRGSSAVSVEHNLFPGRPH